MSAPAPPERAPAAAGPRWPAAVGLVLCALGLAVAAYLTYEHYTAAASLSCPFGGGVVDCYRVTTSAYSMVRGVPVALLGMVFFVVMAALQLPAAWRSQRQEVRLARLAWAALGMVFALWLISVELFHVNAICMWCTSVHVLVFLLFVSTLVGTATTAAP